MYLTEHPRPLTDIYVNSKIVNGLKLKQGQTNEKVYQLSSITRRIWKHRCLWFP